MQQRLNKRLRNFDSVVLIYFHDVLMQDLSPLSDALPSFLTNFALRPKLIKG